MRWKSLSLGFVSVVISFCPLQAETYSVDFTLRDIASGFSPYTVTGSIVTDGFTGLAYLSDFQSFDFKSTGSELSSLNASNEHSGQPLFTVTPSQISFAPAYVSNDRGEFDYSDEVVGTDSRLSFFDNLGDSRITLRTFDSSVLAVGSDTLIATVPEPSTWVMMLLGLGSLGLLGYRKWREGDRASMLAA